MPARKGNPFQLYDDEALFARQTNSRAANRLALESRKVLPVHKKSTVSAQAQAGTWGKEGELNPRRFTSKEKRGWVQGASARHRRLCRTHACSVQPFH